MRLSSIKYFEGTRCYHEWPGPQSSRETSATAWWVVVILENSH